ncbi:kynureninase [Sutcliffiella rhizosphaerae]|uniref:Kynureninase n=1 Tax=Sutcliffiella rhizosphaerae TaxID=2880967 RepID=A0ABN8ACU9_9BACI|nr:kynureninase [Sutcliffiella rhizosphaerae]CAG9620515.1 Kynureninase [Sutcliffiella rhizosphaerae]
MPINLDMIEKWDREDSLSKYREEFYLLKDSIYMDGNSLGLLSKRAEQSLLSMLDSWKKRGIDGWTSGEEPWFYLAEKLGEMSAPLVGARSEEVIVTGSTTTNLHQLLATFYIPDAERTKIVSDELNFPSDIYAIQSILSLKGYKPEEHLIAIKSRDGHTIDEEDIIASLKEDVALLILPTVLYRSGQLFNIEKITKIAHEKGIIVGWDGCHSVGTIPHKFHDWNVDFAYWCNYKYLNSGPGGVGSLFVHEKHFNKTPGLMGWFGSDKQKQFDMEHTFLKAKNSGAYQIGTPHIFSMAPLLGALQMFNEIGMEKLRVKSLHMTKIMMSLIEQELSHFGFKIINPKEDTSRGGHISILHPEAARICKALKEHRVVPDFRKPNIIRLAPVALYNTYQDAYDTVIILKEIMQNKEYEKFTNEREVVA